MDLTPRLLTEVEFREEWRGYSRRDVDDFLERDLSRRLVDFASGLCYGMRGSMERVTNQVYLLTPSNVEVSAEEKRRLRETD